MCNTMKRCAGKVTQYSVRSPVPTFISKTCRGDINLKNLEDNIKMYPTGTAYICELVLSQVHNKWGTRCRSWLRHCATSRKVAGSIPDGVIGIFH